MSLLHPTSAATAPRRAPGPVSAFPHMGAGATPWTLLILIALMSAGGLALVSGATVVNGDGVWHLVWGRALATGELESFFGGPTPHPLLVAMGAATSPLGDGTSYVLTAVLFGPLSFGALVATAVELGRRLSSLWAGIAAGAVILTSPMFLDNGMAARYDLAFAALVLAAAALEAAHPRRGTAPLVALSVAGLIRPEAWVLAGVYWLWVIPGSSWRARAAYAGLVAVGPVMWSAMDFAVMGDPFYSFHITDQYSDTLYRRYTPGENLEVAGRNLLVYVGVVPLLLLAPAAALLLGDRPRAAAPMLVVFGISTTLFLLYVAMGTPSSPRYLMVPACIMAVLAGIAADGRGQRSRARVTLAVALSVLLGVQLLARADVYGDVRADATRTAGRDGRAEQLASTPGVAKAVRRCGSVALPSGKMRHLFAFHTGRPPEAFTVDAAGRTRPDLYLAPADPAIARDVLTRQRFDADASFTVPASMRRGPSNSDWAIHVAPGAACARGLL